MFYQSLAREDTNHTLSKIQIRRNNFKKWLQQHHEMHRLDSSTVRTLKIWGTLCRPVPATVFPVLDPTSVLGRVLSAIRGGIGSRNMTLQ